MNKVLTRLLAASSVCVCFAAGAADPAPAPDAPPLTRSEAKDMKNQSDADYKARKKVAEGHEEVNKADCKTTHDGSVERACKDEAKAAAKKQKSEAKVIHESEKADIKANSK